jgi:hypothetical protein
MSLVTGLSYFYGLLRGQFAVSTAGRNLLPAWGPGWQWLFYGCLTRFLCFSYEPFPSFNFRSGFSCTLQDSQNPGLPLFIPAENDDEEGFNDLVMLVTLAKEGAAQGADDLDLTGRQLLAAGRQEAGLHAETAILILDGKAALARLIGFRFIRTMMIHGLHSSVNRNDGV